jgi:hypothetical protein
VFQRCRVDDRTEDAGRSVAQRLIPSLETDALGIGVLTSSCAKGWHSLAKAARLCEKAQHVIDWGRRAYLCQGY